MHETDEKAERLARLARSEGVGGILVNTQPNFAWLTGGRSNRIDGSRETGNGSLLVTARAIATSSPTTSRCRACTRRRCAGLGFTPLEYRVDRRAGRSVGADSGRAAGDRQRRATIGCDGAFSGGTPIEAGIAAARALLTDAEVERYRALGR